MRELKFRRWDGLDKKMLYDVDIEDDSLRQLDGDNDQVYMQFTGLKDKTGKEIYEGDIVKHREMDKPFDTSLYGMMTVIEQGNPMKVEWINHGFYPFSGWIDEANKKLEWEVIGNIYSNPELISQ